MKTDQKKNLKIVELSCEYLENPLGIDIKMPRLSWKILSNERGQLQTSYQILVSRSLDKLNNNQGDLWDSGRIECDQSIHVPYDGIELESRMRCWWKVCIWDKDGRNSKYSEPAFWEMGLLDECDWQAEWIALDKDTTIGMQMKSCTYLRKEFQLPSVIQKATAYVTAKGVYELHINGKRVGDAVLTPGFTDYRQRVQYQTYDVKKFLINGENTIGAILGEGWYSGHIGMRAKRNYFGTFPQFLLQMEITFVDNTKKIIITDGSWKGTNKGAILFSDMLFGESYDANIMESGWNKVRFDDSAWKDVYSITPAIGKSEPEYDNKSIVLAETKPLSLVSDDDGIFVYEMDRTITGWVRLRLSGEIGQNVRLRYAQMIDTADYKSIYTENITDPEWVTNFKLKGKKLLSYEYPTIVQGFRYIEITGLSNAPKIDDIVACVVNCEAQSPKIVAQRSNPIRITAEIKPIDIVQLDEDTYIFDLGQNIVGWIRLFVIGENGTKVQLRHAEKLNDDGSLSTENLRYAKATDTYILAGRGLEVFEPHFTFHGFRFVELKGFPGKPTLDSLVGCVVHNDMPQIGEFECSNSLINKLWKNIFWTQRGNSISVPTDCPQRDERLGWLHDATRFILTACHNMQAGAFYSKWMSDIVSTQSSLGAFAEVAPRIVTTRDGAPGSIEGIIYIPWVIYNIYGDKRIIEENFEAMKALMHYIYEKNSDYLWKERVNADYADWVSYFAQTPHDLFNTAFWALDALLMAEMSELLGQNDLSLEYKDLYKKIKKVFIKAFVKQDGKLDGDTQTGYALALLIGLVPDHLRSLMIEALVENILQRNVHLSTGVTGTALIGHVLAKSGLMDILYQLLINDTCPSWGYMIKNGATTIWERWDAINQINFIEEVKDSSFYHYKFKARAGMNSFNHPALGSIGICLYKYITGIGFDRKIPGYKFFHISPNPGRHLKYAKAKFQSMYGEIKSDWYIVEDTFRLNLSIPPNTHATVRLPWEEPDEVLESNEHIGNVQGVKMINCDQRGVVFSVESGDYFFTCPYVSNGNL
jgi:alpha-L-rhamnosidase